MPVGPLPGLNVPNFNRVATLWRLVGAGANCTIPTPSRKNGSSTSATGAERVRAARRNRTFALNEQ